MHTADAGCFIYFLHVFIWWVLVFRSECWRKLSVHTIHIGMSLFYQSQSKWNNVKWNDTNRPKNIVTSPSREQFIIEHLTTDTNQSESHSGHQELRFTRNYMGAWRTWRRPPTSSLLLDWSCRRTRRRRALTKEAHILNDQLRTSKLPDL